MGHEYILQAFAEIANDHQLNETVLVFKKYLSSYFPEEYQRVCLRIKELGLEGRVRWLDEIPYEQVPAQYKMADIIVNYPEQDGLPVTFFEVAACKRPVISSDLPDYKGTFDDSFIMVPPKDARLLAQALRTCLTENPEQTQQRVEKAFEIACEIGSQQKNIEVINEVFNQAIHRGTNSNDMLTQRVLI
jgi:glycosyltransferase involved in cell wall biosynthesis